MKLLRHAVLLLFLVLPLRAYDVVVSIRYLQIKGKSHATLWLFDERGKQIRQLTRPGEDQDYAPVFSPDGGEIVFRRMADEKAEPKWFSVDRAGKKTRPLPDGPPEWYATRTMAKAFGNKDGNIDGSAETTFADADGSRAIVLKPNPEDEEHPFPFLRPSKDGPLLPFSEMPGYARFWFAVLQDESPFFNPGKLNAVFYGGEHDSSLGTTMLTLDVNKKRIVTLSANGAVVFPWPGRDGFWVIAESRYEELGDGRTVNCLYLDWYDQNLGRTRFGRKLGKYGGASVYVPRKGVFHLPSPID